MREQTLYYHDGLPVLLGDQIRARAFLIPIRGSVVYVTGQSDPLPDFDWPLMASIAIELRSGRTISWTRPTGARLERHFCLVSRKQDVTQSTP